MSSHVPTHEADVQLAAAALRGDAAALERLDALLTSEGVTRGLRPFEQQGVLVADVVQSLRQKLLVAEPGQSPKLQGYGGRASLGSWLRAAAVRTAVNLKRQVRSRHTDVEAQALPLDSSDPELLMLRQRHGEQLSLALKTAFDSLSDRDVNLLRAHYLDGVKAYRLAASHGVSAATVSRWLTSAREQWLLRAREALCAQLTLNDSQVSSLLQGMRSGFHASLERWMDERG